MVAKNYCDPQVTLLSTSPHQLWWNEWLFCSILKPNPWFPRDTHSSGTSATFSHILPQPFTIKIWQNYNTFFKAQPSNIWTKSSGLSTINKPQCQSALNNPESLLNPNKIFEKTCSTTISSKIQVKEALKGLFDWVDILQGDFKSVETVDSCLCRSMSLFRQRL